MQKASARLVKMKGSKIPYSWKPELTTYEQMCEDYNATPEEFMVVYADDEPIAAAIIQVGDKTEWAQWPTKKHAIYGYRFAGNPDSPIEKTKLLFPALKQYAKQVKTEAVRIDIAEFEHAKLRLYKSQGFKQVGICGDGVAPEKYILLECDI